MADNLLNETSGPVESTDQGVSPAVTNEQPVEFISTLSEDLQGLSNLKDFKDVNQLAKSYVELQRMVGNSVRIPANDASDEAKQEFYTKIKDLEGVLIKGDEKLYDKLGRPEAPDAYKFEEILKAEVLESVPGMRDELDAFRQIAHEAGLTAEQASKIVEFRAKSLEGYEAKAAESRQLAEDSLKKMWGQDYDNRVNAAKQAINILREKHGESVDALINSEAGNNPALINMLSEMAGMYKEKNHVGTSNVQFGVTPEIAAQKIADKRADKGFMRAYTDDMHPGHRKAVEDMAKLYAIVSGSGV